jgi:hypothetical protein
MMKYSQNIISDPINKIIKANQILQKNEEDQQKKDILDLCISHSKSLQNALNDFQDYTSVQNNTFKT